jgi:hypothetical protein
MGRPRTSVETRILNGNSRKRPIPKEPAIPTWDGQRQLNVEFSSPYARDFYENFAPHLQKWLTKADEPNLILLAETWGRLMDSMRGPAKGKDNFWRISQQFISLSSRFGLTPTDRLRLGVEAKTSEGPGSAARPAGRQLVYDGPKLN